MNFFILKEEEEEKSIETFRRVVTIKEEMPTATRAIFIKINVLTKVFTYSSKSNKRHQYLNNAILSSDTRQFFQ